jgi:hypothetical protein
VSLHSPLLVSARALFFPETHFRDRRPSFPDAGRLVLAVAGLHAAGYYLLLLAGAAIVAGQQATFGAGELLADLGIGAYAAGVVVALLVLVDWVVVSAVLHAVVRFRGGEGTYTDTLSVVGWSAPATLLGLLVGGAGFLLALHGNTLTMSYDAKLVTVSPTVALAGGVGALLTLLWQGKVWPPGLARSHDIDRTTAARTAAATVVLCGLALLLTL